MFSHKFSASFIYFFTLCFGGLTFFINNEVKAERPNLQEKPDLIVGVVVEKMRYDYLTRMWDRFGENGFKKLVSEGSSFSNARYEYLVNQSAPGYSTIFTGANPSAHGIIADQWYDRLSNSMQSPVFDDRVIAVGGSFDKGRRSPTGLLAGTLGDELRMATDFRSRVYTVSMNDVSAVLAGGYSANAAWWFDDISGEWMSSSFYIDSLPFWVKDFNDGMLPDTYLERAWEPLAEYAAYFSIDDDHKTGPFSYNLRRMHRRSDNYGLLRATPWANTFTKDFALNLIVHEQLGRTGSTDMIVIGFSGTAEIDRLYGTFSPEVQDAYLRLDNDIAHLIGFFEEHFGKSNVLFFLTSDQAVTYPASYQEAARIPGGTFSPGIAMSLLRSYLNVTFERDDWVTSYNAGMVYLNRDLIEDRNIPLDLIQNRASRFINQFSGVAGTVNENVLNTNYFDGGVSARIQNGFHPKRSGDIMVYLRQGWYERSVSGDRLDMVSYDQHVPLLFYGWNMKSMNIRREVSPADITPTISLLLDIPTPPFTTGRPIMELF